MEFHNIKRLPVMRRSKLVGILNAVSEQSWTAGASVDVIVRDSVADLWGTISDVVQREALKVLVARTPGVTKVEDHLT